MMKSGSGARQAMRNTEILDVAPASIPNYLHQCVVYRSQELTFYRALLVTHPLITAPPKIGLDPSTLS